MSDKIWDDACAEAKSQKFRKLPVVIEAVQVTAADFNGSDFDGNPFSSNPEWLRKAFEDGVICLSRLSKGHTDYAEWDIKTLEGIVIASPGDWIIRGVKGELYPCKPDIFAITYAADDKLEASNIVMVPLEPTPDMIEAAACAMAEDQGLVWSRLEEEFGFSYAMTNTKRHWRDLARIAYIAAIDSHELLKE